MTTDAGDELNNELSHLSELAGVLGVGIDLNTVDAAGELDRVDAEFSKRITQYPESVQAMLQQRWQLAFQPIRAKVVIEQERLLKEAAKADAALAETKEQARNARANAEEAVTTAKATAESVKDSAETVRTAAAEIISKTTDSGTTTDSDTTTDSGVTEEATETVGLSAGDSTPQGGTDVGEQDGVGKSKKAASGKEKNKAKTKKKKAKSGKTAKGQKNKTSQPKHDDAESESVIIAPIVELIEKLETEKIASRRNQIIDSNTSMRLRLRGELEIPAGKAAGQRMPSGFTDGRRLSCTMAGKHRITLLTPASINEKMDELNVGEIVDIGVSPSGWNLALNRLELVAVKRKK